MSILILENSIGVCPILRPKSSKPACFHPFVMRKTHKLANRQEILTELLRTTSELYLC
jgi:hypothetical protein